MDLASAFVRMPLFAGLSAPALRAFVTAAEVQDLRSGQCLYAEGDAATHLYCVLSGRLRVMAAGQLVGYIGRLELVGEIGVLSGEAHLTTVHAVRDGVVARIPASTFSEFLQDQPAVHLAVTRLVIQRLRQYHHPRRHTATENQGTIAIVPGATDMPIAKLAESLVQRLGAWPQARLIGSAHVDAALGPGRAQTDVSAPDEDRRLHAWLSELEGHHRYVVYAADNAHDAWMRRCLRQADRVLVLADASRAPEDVPSLQALRAGGLLARVELVLLRPEAEASPHTLAWLEQSGARTHYFLHPGDTGGLDTLARQVTGRGVGLVLGGGGARGFAHIGLVRALEQLRIPVDVAGGTSMGAFFAALLACGFDSVAMTHIARETFVMRSHLNDYTLPRVSLIRGQKFLTRLRQIFGERRIEDLRRSYYCVSTNLTTGATVVSDRGLVAEWVGTSMAVPGIAPPIAYEGELLCDGGVVDNLPTAVMQSLERGAIIASNVGTEGDLRAPGAGHGHLDSRALLQWTGPGQAPSLSEILLRTATLTSDTRHLRAAAERADVYLGMPIQDIRMFDWQRLDELVERGYQHALEILGPLRDTLVH